MHIKVWAGGITMLKKEYQDDLSGKHQAVPDGLTTAEAEKRRETYGFNQLEDMHKKSTLQLFWEQLNDPLIYILMAAIAVSLFLGEVGESAIIAAVILLNAVVGVIQEGKALKAIEALRQLASPKALVLRDGREQEILSRELVPGDVILLEAGRQVPADGQLMEAKNLKADEAALTGESVPVSKLAAVSEQPEGTKAAEAKDMLSAKGNAVPDGGKEEAAELHAAAMSVDRKDMVYMTTMITSGHGRAVVTQTGMDTQIGRIAGMIAESPEEMTPLQKRLADLGKLLSLVAIGICVFLFVVAVLQKRDIGEMLLTAISLAVAAVPEGLAAIVTVVLALSVSRMVRVGTIVRKLPSVETLGAVNVVCSDKTGTLTQNRMTVTQCYADGGYLQEGSLSVEKYGRFLQACVLCNDAVAGEEPIGDPTELALLYLGEKYGLHKTQAERECPRTEERAFESERKKMTTVHREGAGEIAFIKGAPDRILSDCRSVLKNGKEVAFSERARKETQLAVEEMASRALRVMALAMKTKGTLTDEKDMVFLGLVGMIDPPREGVAEAVQSFRGAHVDTVMITGDHADTAFAIAKELGIAADRAQCIRGEELEQMSEEALEGQIENIRVFARVSPEHKVRIVNAWKKKGKIVAMTGDGINDAPALRTADIGVAMGKGGTDVARNAADLILTDDNFTTIEKAIREGRGIYENIRKTVLFLLSSNFGEIITMLVAILAGFPATLKASHILWVNLITDSLPALSLGMDSNDGEELMKLPPRKSEEGMFAHGGLSCTLCYGAVIGVISILAYLTVPYEELLQRGFQVNLENMKKLLEVEWILNKAQTHAFTVLGMSQLVHAVGMRDVHCSVFRMKHLDNVYMLASLLLGFLLQFLVTEIPYLVGLFETSRLSLEEWLRLGVLALVPLLVHELLCLFTAVEQRQAQKEAAS